MANFVSSSDDSSDLDEDILSLHQADSQSSHTTLRSNSPVNQGGQITHLPPTTVASVACEHIIELLNDPPRAERLLKRHRKFVCWGAQISQGAAEIRASGERPGKRRRLQMPSCNDCGKTLQRPFVCLECVFAGCWRNAHIVDHLEKTGHDFALDINSGSIFCAACDDLIYHPGLESTFNSVVMKIGRKRIHMQDLSAPRFDYRELLRGRNSSIISCTGRKGLLNLGASCYLSVVLQALVHNPFVRNWFMSDKHPNQLCSRAFCLCCEMDKLFSKVYAADPSPLAPDSFLRTLWHTSPELAGYAQQDAHEILIAILNSIHSHSTTRSNSPHGPMCTCVIHSTFGAQLQSDVTCGRCGTVRSTQDPLLDISLELEPSSDSKDNTLIRCLKRYTRTERLGPKEQPLCQSCGTVSENATRRLSIRKLPPVLCFQFKRFEHKSTSTQKIDAPVQFPSALDMAPFTSLSINGQGEGTVNLDPIKFAETLCSYDLFAVINHEGQMDTGHYTAFARSQDTWYKFDDEKVTSASLGDVLSSRSKAYMCFYIRKQLNYGSKAPSSTSRPASNMNGSISTPGSRSRTLGSTPSATPNRSVIPLPQAQRLSLMQNPISAAQPRFVPPASAGLPRKPTF